MLEFPLLKTGAVVQYPVRRLTAYSTQTLRFLDGGEQRFRLLDTPARKWVVHLSLLDDGEAAQLQQFFSRLQGSSGRFSFTDPWTAITHPNCSLELEELRLEFAGPGQCRSTLLVRQNR